MLHQDQYEQSIQLFPEDISLDFKEALRNHGVFITLKKGDILINEAQNNQKIYYITQGSLIRSVITPEGIERAIMFHTENFLQDVSNIFMQSDDSEVSYLIKANEPTRLFCINADFGYEWAKKDSVFVEFLFKRSLQYSAINNQIQNHLIGLSSEAFYEWLIKKYGFLFQRFLSKDIASFMGVSPVWFSNIKRHLSKK